MGSIPRRESDRGRQIRLYLGRQVPGDARSQCRRLVPGHKVGLLQGRRHLRVPSQLRALPDLQILALRCR